LWDDAVAVVKVVLRASLMVVHLEYARVAWMVEQKGQYSAVKTVSHLAVGKDYQSVGTWDGRSVRELA